ncbi:MAG: RNA-binding S4 domain-containing protein [Leptotrichiaceae bacterium]|nr:RNA-binding S4 domain-containing protein [Leptotrichiaceae bacterium]MBP7725701.1 RNA-binding S4 domain-containing protein [Leptotrichiaceae bacterium]MBP9629736.1 RNA-binding S4 domain-containing protein [Leptotrichiaceae bacterium]
MRLDKFLKITRIIKRRTIAKELADNGNISVLGDEKKSSYSVKKGDVLEIKYFNKNIKVKIKELPPENLKKDYIEDYIEIVE